MRLQGFHFFPRTRDVIAPMAWPRLGASGSVGIDFVIRFLITTISAYLVALLLICEILANPLMESSLNIQANIDRGFAGNPQANCFPLLFG